MKKGSGIWLAVAASAGLMASVPAGAKPSAEQQAEGRINNADKDGNGVVSLPEFQAFREGVVAKNPNMNRSFANPAIVRSAFKSIDKDNNGEIDKGEFTFMIEGIHKRK